MTGSGPGVLGLSLEELSRGLGSRRAALAFKRGIYARNPVTSGLLPPASSGRGGRWLSEQVLPDCHLVSSSRSRDGTLKLLLQFGGASVETVLIPGRTRSTVCLSCQAGCSRACRFCATSGLGLVRSLSASEIVLQYLVARSFATAPPRNVVFMGMGEPMDNLEQVMRSIVHLTEPPMPALAETHVTVSTSGVVPGIRRFLREGRGNLAVSLSATTDAARTSLVPHGARWPIHALLDALREGLEWRRNRRYLIEYVLFEGMNDGEEDARALAALLAGLPARVNLIPHNPFPGSRLTAPSRERVELFQRVVRASGLRCLVRRPFGADVAAACGQLALGHAGAAPGGASGDPADS